MNNKHRRVLWLLNHKTLMFYEVPLMLDLGFEVFVPKVIPKGVDFRSGAVDYQWDSFLTIPKHALDILGSFNFYEESWTPEIVRLINRYFGAVFIIPHGQQPVEALMKFEGLIMFRAFGLDNSMTYIAALRALYGMRIFKLIKAAGERFWFAQGYQQLAECEAPILASRDVFLPLGLPTSYWQHEETWRGGGGKILFVCPNLVTNSYYAGKYREFKAAFGALPHVIVGAQDAPVDDPNVRGFVTNEELVELYQTSEALCYPSHERRHIHYSPIEAMVTGTPVVFYSDSLLARLCGRHVKGEVKTDDEARDLLKSLIDGTRDSRRLLREDQRGISFLFSDEYCKPEWVKGVERCGLGREIKTPVLRNFWNESKRLFGGMVRGDRAKALADFETPSLRDLSLPMETLNEGNPEEGIDFTQKNFPLFLRNVEGLSDCESFGRWSDGSVIRFCLEKPIVGRVNIEIEGGAYDKNINCPVTVRCGGASRTVLFHRVPWEPEFQVAKLNIKEPCSDVEIIVPHPTQDSPGGHRKIGLGLRSIRFVPVHGGDENADDGVDFRNKEYPFFLEEIRGVSEWEAWGRWSDGPRIELRLESPLKGRVNIEIVGWCIEENQGCPIKVKCGGGQDSVIFNSQSWQFTKQVAKLKLSKPSSIVEIFLPHTKQDGHRKIGIGLRRIRFVNKNKPPAGKDHENTKKQS
jgi:hypothetical protein